MLVCFGIANLLAKAIEGSNQKAWSSLCKVEIATQKCQRMKIRLDHSKQGFLVSVASMDWEVPAKNMRRKADTFSRRYRNLALDKSM